MGHSGGGYLALTAGFCVGPRPKSVFLCYGYDDIASARYSLPDPVYGQQPAVTKEGAYSVIGKEVVSESNSRGRFRFYLYCRQNGLWPNDVAGHDPDKQAKAFNPFCPVRNVTKQHPPTLLLHGDRDTDVPHEQSKLMAEVLKGHQVDTT